MFLLAALTPTSVAGPERLVPGTHNERPCCLEMLLIPQSTKQLKKMPSRMQLVVPTLQH